MCGALLHQFDARTVGNTFYGPPMNRDGDLLRTGTGAPMTTAQPPFLLRFSPRLFAKEAPAVFAYDERTNTLSLKATAQPPWIRTVFGRGVDRQKTWKYCADCKDRYCQDNRRQNRNHVPYRDKEIVFNSPA